MTDTTRQPITNPARIIPCSHCKTGVIRLGMISDPSCLWCGHVAYDTPPVSAEVVEDDLPAPSRCKRGHVLAEPNLYRRVDNRTGGSYTFCRACNDGRTRLRRSLQRLGKTHDTLREK